MSFPSGKDYRQVGGTSIATLSPAFLRFLIRIALAFEPLAPTAISFFLVRYLRVWHQQGLISDYRAHTRRLGKFHYKVEIDMEVTDRQARYILTHVLPSRIKALGR